MELMLGFFCPCDLHAVRALSNSGLQMRRTAIGLLRILSNAVSLKAKLKPQLNDNKNQVKINALSVNLDSNVSIYMYIYIYISVYI